LPLAALLALTLGLFQIVVNQRNQDRPLTAPPVDPARSPFAETVAGAGLVESASENVHIGSALPGIVLEVSVPAEKVGTLVQKGDPLFRVDDRQLQGQLAVAVALVTHAEAELEQLKQSPRPESLPPLHAAVRAAEAIAKEREDAVARLTKSAQAGATTAQELLNAQQELQVALANRDLAQAQLALTEAGTWSAELTVATARVAAAQADAQRYRMEVERATVRAPMDARVIAVDVRPGEYVAATPGDGLMVLVSESKLRVRVDIDERDLPRYTPGTSAQAFARGDAHQPIPLRFVRVDPFVIPKHSLTGDTTERVDTRVLQAIYEVESPSVTLYIGQQLDVFINARSAATLPAGTTGTIPTP
jgi:multidrug resistance efflux pump